MFYMNLILLKPNLNPNKNGAVFYADVYIFHSTEGLERAVWNNRPLWGYILIINKYKH